MIWGWKITESTQKAPDNLKIPPESKKRTTNISSLNFCGKKDARHISAEQNKVELINIYVPAGGDVPDPNLNSKFSHKLAFLDELNKLLKKKKMTTNIMQKN